MKAERAKKSRNKTSGKGKRHRKADVGFRYKVPNQKVPNYRVPTNKGPN